MRMTDNSMCPWHSKWEKADFQMVCREDNLIFNFFKSVYMKGFWKDALTRQHLKVRSWLRVGADKTLVSPPKRLFSFYWGINILLRNSLAAWSYGCPQLKVNWKSEDLDPSASVTGGGHGERELGIISDVCPMYSQPSIWQIFIECLLCSRHCSVLCATAVIRQTKPWVSQSLHSGGQ